MAEIIQLLKEKFVVPGTWLKVPLLTGIGSHTRKHIQLEKLRHCGLKLKLGKEKVSYWLTFKLAGTIIVFALKETVSRKLQPFSRAPEHKCTYMYKQLKVIYITYQNMYKNEIWDYYVKKTDGLLQG